MIILQKRLILHLAVGLCLLSIFSLPGSVLARHPVSREHPRLLGTGQELQELARLRKSCSLYTGCHGFEPAL